ncbi:MAG TPA: sulfotransferase [Gemmatimonadales bacterium]|nr:sulfotransferase [Gemmatimonadales bacterium]
MNLHHALFSLVPPARAWVLSLNHWLRHYQNVTWLVGDGRSGTTWISDLLKHGRSYREMFEPFHPRLVEGMGFLAPHQYVRPEDSHPKLERAASDVFSGRFRNRRVDSGNRSMVYRGLLIKDIFANLFSRWASLRFPSVRIVLLLRNPFTVALSKQKLPTWHWVTEPLDLLNQTPLYQDHLRPFEDLIRKTSREGDFISRQVLIWSIINYVPLRQFGPEQIRTVFYEDVVANPSAEISSIRRFVEPNTNSEEAYLPPETVARPSRVVRVPGERIGDIASLAAWKNELTTRQIDTGRDILGCFGFGKLYDDASMPVHSVLSGVRSWS